MSNTIQRRDLITLLATVLDTNGNPITDAIISVYADTDKKTLEAVLNESNDKGQYLGTVESKKTYCLDCVALNYGLQSTTLDPQDVEYKVTITMK